MTALKNLKILTPSICTVWLDITNLSISEDPIFSLKNAPSIGKPSIPPVKVYQASLVEMRFFKDPASSHRIIAQDHILG
jgi:hypothetical protein